MEQFQHVAQLATEIIGFPDPVPRRFLRLIASGERVFLFLRQLRVFQDQSDRPGGRQLLGKILRRQIQIAQRVHDAHAIFQTKRLILLLFRAFRIAVDIAHATVGQIRNVELRLQPGLIVLSCHQILVRGGRIGGPFPAGRLVGDQDVECFKVHRQHEGAFPQDVHPAAALQRLPRLDGTAALRRRGSALRCAGGEKQHRPDGCAKPSPASHGNPLIFSHAISPLSGYSRMLSSLYAAITKESSTENML